ncbi:MAG: 3-dehydroquinate synthase [Bacteroidales bacterium]|nr:3-dehydroquinate synthase [Bacteroidales bacterium]
MKLIPNTVFYDISAFMALRKVIFNVHASGRKIFILTDSNTRQFCLPMVMEELGDLSQHLVSITIAAGENNKHLQTAMEVWEQLSVHQAGRDALLINLGGGMVTDLGGFVASVYKRGIETIHVPTTMLAMVDAAIGGKTGVDFMHLKNNLGTFHGPSWVFVITKFLETLPSRQYRSGIAEIIKYGFISRPELLKQDLFNIEKSALQSIIGRCIDAKTNIVQADPEEQGIRKLLNLGHTVGHAFEAMALMKQQDLLHGEAVASGLVCELYISTRLLSLDTEVLDHYIGLWQSAFLRYPVAEEDDAELMNLMLQDKKNRAGKLLFTLISAPGNAVFDIPVGQELIEESLQFYRSLF